ncbi:hypothetical protein PAPYR_13203 [Paratrimastix pyriformis]|uniref:Uncharacterized protein n=1 Tax=Paratrimastix pyriformis TaxID=342808 RepID=A0ABQ8U0N3_9EUKA|nr:hypothetical protein PAPYR_13203 [Paratrimastix pyriformis]
MPSEAFAVRLYSAFQSGSPAAVYDNLVRVGAIDSAYRSFCVSGRLILKGPLRLKMDLHAHLSGRAPGDIRIIRDVFTGEYIRQHPVVQGDRDPDHPRNVLVLRLLGDGVNPWGFSFEDIFVVGFVIENLSPVLRGKLSNSQILFLVPKYAEIEDLSSVLEPLWDRQIFGILGPSSFDYEATALDGTGACATFPCIQCKEAKTRLFQDPNAAAPGERPPRTFLDQRAHCRLLARALEAGDVSQALKTRLLRAWIISGRARFDALAHLPTIFFPVF